jgi:hypothetical protein
VCRALLVTTKSQSLSFMKKHQLILGLVVACLSGCASAPLSKSVSAVSVTTHSGDGVHVFDAGIEELDGRLAVCGKAKLASRWTPAVPMHLDVQFWGVGGQALAFKSAPIYLRGRFGAHGHPAPVFFQIHSEPWPQATTRIVVSPHEGAEHSSHGKTNTSS